MSKQPSRGQKAPIKKNHKKTWGIAVIIAVIAMGVFAATSFGLDKEKSTGEVQIVKSEVTSTAKFYPVVVDNVKMEVIAVKASDGTIRTAFNTCQICYSSGRGYYTQVGNELICENCKNRFKIDEVEKVKNGCNPVPILKADRKEDAKTIVISKEFLAQYKGLFAYWNKK